jgi:8-oxo-dGTP diphosphatase
MFYNFVDILGKMEQNTFEIIARAFIVRDGKILACKNRTKDYWFLPGGHIEQKETIASALIREIKEEIGVAVVTYTFIGVAENMYMQSGKDVHECNFIFDTEIENISIESQESHLEVKWMSAEEFGAAKILPQSLQKAVLKYLEDRTPFFIEQPRV